MSRVSIVIPVHGQAGLTRRCLDALLAAPEADALEIVVVDDASPDDTPALLAGYGDRVRALRLEANGGFAEACNRGAAVARGELLLFLNNDVLPAPGWLGPLVATLDAHPDAAAAGAKLLFPDGTVQHAGVVIGQDGHPRHLYAGFPGDHPAVGRPRRFQAVTAACMLVRRAAFEAAGGFDTAYRNGLEDVDLCLRLGEAGHEVRYCPESVLCHLESVSRGRRSPEIDAGIRLFQERWSGRVRRDDLERYVEDGLLRVAYDDTYPLRVAVSAELAALEDGGRAEELDRLLVRRSRHVADLLRDVVRLTVRAAGRQVPAAAEDAGESAAPVVAPRWRAPLGERELDSRVRALERLIRELQTDLAAGDADGGFTPSPGLGYREQVEHVRSLVRLAVPDDGRVAVIGRGDDELLVLDGRPACHFPRGADGGYAGFYPADGAAAAAHLEELRADGIEFLVVPAAGAWWLDAYPELGRHLNGRYAALASEDGVATIYDLRSAVAPRTPRRESAGV